MNKKIVIIIGCIVPALIKLSAVKLRERKRRREIELATLRKSKAGQRLWKKRRKMSSRILSSMRKKQNRKL